MTNSQTKFKTRFYNDIKLSNGIIVKSSSESRIKTEFEWFLEAKKLIPNFIPDILSVNLNSRKSMMSMSYIKGLNLYQKLLFETDSNNLVSFLKDVRVLTDLMSKEMINIDIKSDYQEMYLNKPLDAIKYFKFNFPNFANKELFINGKRCIDPELILPKLYETFINKFTTSKHSFIHGDLTLSNMIIKNNKHIVLIDPRGRFGNTKFYGDTNYDIAKLYFSLITNFDSLNLHKFNIDTSSENYYFSIKEITNVDNKEKLFWNIFKHNQELIMFICSTIWLSLSPHLCESDDQTIISYLQGNYLLNKIYNIRCK